MPKPKTWVIQIGDNTYLGVHYAASITEAIEFPSVSSAFHFLEDAYGADTKLKVVPYPK